MLPSGWLPFIADTINLPRWNLFSGSIHGNKFLQKNPLLPKDTKAEKEAVLYFLPSQFFHINVFLFQGKKAAGTKTILISDLYANG